MKFTEITVYTSCECSELVADILWNYTNYGVAISDENDIKDLKKQSVKSWDYIDDSLIKGETEVLVKCFVPLDITENAVKGIAADLETLRINCGLNTGSLETVRRVVDGDEWREIWKSHYRPIKMGKITVCPEWFHYSPEKGEQVVKIDSNMAFGTGEHETTAMCIELLQKYLKPGDRAIDVGTGSGILGISAVKLGAERAYMTDIDYIAVQSATANAAKNGVADKTTVTLNDLLKDEKVKGNLLTANITADVLIKLCKSLHSYLESGSVAILSGIIKSRLEEVANTYATHGFAFAEKLERGEWCALALRYNGAL